MWGNVPRYNKILPYVLFVSCNILYLVEVALYTSEFIYQLSDVEV